MLGERIANDPDSIAEILSRAFDSAVGMPPAAAELILRARFPEADVKRVDQLLEQKRDIGLSPAEESLLHDYLQADSLLTVLKSKAHRALGTMAIP
jgi:hypothetical protein